MKTLALALLVPTSLAFAAPPPRGPDFVGPHPVRSVDRSLALSSGHDLIEPGDIVFFGLDRWVLDQTAMSQLADTAHWLLAHPGQRIVVEGYADILGTPSYNLDLGRRRAENVRGYLMYLGVSSDRILVVTIGAAGAHCVENENDRRVVFFASTLPMHALATAELNSKPAIAVAWTDRGARLEEHNGFDRSPVIARR